MSQSIALSFNQLAALALTFVTLPLYNYIQSWALVPLFIIPMIICLIFLYFNLPETKDRDIREVIADLKKKKKESRKNKYEMTESEIETEKKNKAANEI